MIIVFSIISAILNQFETKTFIYASIVQYFIFIGLIFYYFTITRISIWSPILLTIICGEIGALFKIMHYPGASLLLIISSVGVLIYGVSCLVEGKKMKSGIPRNLTFGLGLALILQTSLSYSFPSLGIALVFVQFGIITYLLKNNDELRIGYSKATFAYGLLLFMSIIRLTV